MCYRFGKPTFFITVNKNDGCCVDVVWLSDPAHSGALPTRKYRYRLLGTHPGAATVAFERMIRLFVEEIPLCGDLRGSEDSSTAQHSAVECSAVQC